jgi:predicted transcriptional regulator
LIKCECLVLKRDTLRLGRVGCLTKYRRRFDILADIVRVAGTGARKTKIMYFANLSFVLLNKYLEDALHVGFLRFNDERYLMTRKGETFLEHYAKFSSDRLRVNRDLEKLQFRAEVLEMMCRPENARGKNGGRRTVAALG